MLTPCHLVIQNQITPFKTQLTNPHIGTCLLLKDIDEIVKWNFTMELRQHERIHRKVSCLNNQKKKKYQAKNNAKNKTNKKKTISVYNVTTIETNCLTNS